MFTEEFKGFKFNISDKEYVYSPGDFNELKKSQSDIMNFISKFTNDQGEISDVVGYHKSLSMAMNPENIFSPKGQEIRGRAKALTKRQQAGYIQGRLGLLIDGTGKDYAKIKKMSDSLKNIGYDTYMMFVNTSLDTAQQRNMMRERKLEPDEVAEMWKAVQSNMGKFQRYFGRENFILIDNNNATEKIFDKSVANAIANENVEMTINKNKAMTK